jgi:hypothetical protein
MLQVVVVPVLVVEVAGDGHEDNGQQFEPTARLFVGDDGGGSSRLGGRRGELHRGGGLVRGVLDGERHVAFTFGVDGLLAIEQRYEHVPFSLLRWRPAERTAWAGLDLAALGSPEDHTEHDVVYTCSGVAQVSFERDGLTNPVGAVAVAKAGVGVVVQVADDITVACIGRSLLGCHEGGEREDDAGHNSRN